ncbi:hypothetical protein HanRHA438_Chr13g0613861 [Helianthus annuus]|nr:hypothetical protein HanRHA438_Chr13g0613861 [Helianthus annuus]
MVSPIIAPWDVKYISSHYPYSVRDKCMHFDSGRVVFYGYDSTIYVFFIPSKIYFTV